MLEKGNKSWSALWAVLLVLSATTAYAVTDADDQVNVIDSNANEVSWLQLGNASNGDYRLSHDNGVFTINNVFFNGITNVITRYLRFETDSLAVGRIASASGANATALGPFATVFGDGGTAVGYLSEANGLNSTALGERAEAGDAVTNAAAIGARALVARDNSMVLGSVPGENGGTQYVDVGIGTTTPQAPLHIQRTTSSGPQEMFRFTNTGGSFITWEKTAGNQKWFMTHENAAAGRLIIDHQDNDGLDGPEFALDTDGNITVQGAMNAAAFNVPSDRNLKQGIVELDGAEILARLEAMPVSEWRYKADPDTRHIGPMAQDFHAAFSLGKDDKHVSPTDMAGVNMAAIKALKSAHERAMAQKDAEIAELRAQLDTNNRALQVRLEALEARYPLVQASMQ